MWQLEPIRAYFVRRRTRETVVYTVHDVLQVKIPDRGPHLDFVQFQFSSFAIMSPDIWLGNSRDCM